MPLTKASSTVLDIQNQGDEGDILTKKLDQSFNWKHASDIKEIQDIKNELRNSRPMMNMDRAVSRWARMAELHPTGYGALNVPQGFVLDQANQYMYCLHVTADKGVINRFGWQSSDMNSLDNSNRSTVLGHQGLGIQHMENNKVKLWSAKNTELGGPEDWRYAIRFTYNPNDDISEIESFKVIPDFIGDHPSNITPCVSKDERFLIVRYDEPGPNEDWVFVYDLKQMTTPGDYTSQYLTYWRMDPDSYNLNDIAFQTMCCDSDYIYVIAGAAENVPKKFSAYTLYGEYIGHWLLKAGMEDVVDDNYEPEGIDIVYINGEPTFVYLMSTGPTGNHPRYLYKLGSGNPMTILSGHGMPGIISRSALDLGVTDGETVQIGHWDPAAKTKTDRLTIYPDGKTVISNNPNEQDAFVLIKDDGSTSSKSIITRVVNTQDSLPNGAILQQLATKVLQSPDFDYLRMYSSSASLDYWGDVQFKFTGDANGKCDGAWIGGGADYAEFFEWEDQNPFNEDRRGMSVSLIGDKIKIAENGENPIGIVSAKPAIVGDEAWSQWHAKYKTDEYGAYIRDEEGHRVLNPDYNFDQEYKPRSKRPEWACIGLMGKLYLRKGQITAPTWIKMSESDNVERWLVK